MSNKIFKYNFSNIDTVHGVCDNCQQSTILVAIVSDFYRCVTCGFDTKQYVNGSIKYLKISDKEKKWLRNHNTV